MITAAIIAKIAPWLLGLMGLLGLYWRGHHNGVVKANRDALEKRAASEAKQQEAINHADTGVGATDIERIIRLRKFADGK